MQTIRENSGTPAEQQYKRDYRDGRGRGQGDKNKMPFMEWRFEVFNSEYC